MKGHNYERVTSFEDCEHQLSCINYNNINHTDQDAITLKIRNRVHCCSEEIKTIEEQSISETELENIAIKYAQSLLDSTHETEDRTIEMVFIDDDVLFMTIDMEIQTKANEILKLILSDITGISYDVCLKIISYLPFQQQFIQFKPLDYDTIYFTMLLNQNIIHYLIFFLMVYPIHNSAYIPFIYLILCIFETFIIIYIFTKFNGFIGPVTLH
eukprot:98257_1